MGSGEFTGIKELDDLSQEIAQLQRYVPVMRLIHAVESPDLARRIVCLLFSL